MSDSFHRLNNHQEITFPRCPSIFIFDFDLTLTFKHIYNDFVARGNKISLNEYISKHDPIMDASFLSRCFAEVKKEGGMICIASFGIKEIILLILQHYKLDSYIDEVITPETFMINDEIMGTLSIKRNDQERLQMNIYPVRTLISKASMVEYILKRYPKQENMYFFDDQEENCKDVSSLSHPSLFSFLVSSPLSASTFRYSFS